MPTWKAILWILGVLILIAVLVYPFMKWRVEQRELECDQRCAGKGFNSYQYVPPRGAIRVTRDECECVNKK